MIVIKFIVLFVYGVYSLRLNHYCDICRNHTLCLFIETGPNIACKSYNNAALLTRVEIDEIVNRINVRRNYIAMGLNNILPQAANMKKIFWSFELAAFAQRWVDRCDQSLQPDKEDQCRDLAHTEVGQNIATILGPTPGLHVKSFIEMWYMQILKYKGIVTYYNQSWHHNTDYFTQLIWAETDSVGCGKARFYVESKNTIVERLVCNFAPKGNNHGKPIYTIGYPSTQCSSDMMPDREYIALCVKRYNSTARKFITQRSHVSSVLRILNLSNNSVKQEIDPIGNNLKQIINTTYTSQDQRNQKIRHVYFNHSHGEMKRVSPLRKHNHWNPPMNVSNINQHERGHSRVYHGYESHVHTQDENNYQNFRKYDFTSNSMNVYSSSDFRKYRNQKYQCTRKMNPPRNNYAAHECNTPSCTRGQKNNNWHQCTICHSSTFIQDLNFPSNCNAYNGLCSCQKQTTSYTTPTRCTCDTYCRCLHIGVTPRCPDLLRIKDNLNQDETRKSKEFQLYDLPAPLVVRSGNGKLVTSYLSPRSQPYYNKAVNKNNSREDYGEYHEQVNESNIQHELINEDRDYLYETFDSSRRNRRSLEDHITFKPFWEIDQYSHKRPSELKSIRYTTLGIKSRKNTKRTTLTSKPKTVTESITITLKNTPISRGIKHYISEKYLSFDELMHLRKFTAETTYQNARRIASDDNISREENKNLSPTTEITTNTPFVRNKHCTRKLTCTWTALTLSGGEMMAGGGGFDRGSRTPPGYVDGCSRTSTCTREFMDRNKMSTIPDNYSSEATSEDEDYCERRALNVQRRNLENKIITDLTVDYQKTFYIQPTASTTEIKYEAVSTTQRDTAMFFPQYGCICNHESSRIKRDEYLNNKQPNLKDYKGYVTKMSFKNDISFSNIRGTKRKTRQNSINSFHNNFDSIKCLCSNAANVIVTYGIVFYLLMLLI